MIAYFLLAVASYLIGSIPFSLIFSKLLKGIDVRESGSGNVGATNALVTAGKRAAALGLIFDVAKGFSAVILARTFIGTDVAVILAAVFSILGHDFPFYLNFSGGKGVAPTAGAMIAIDPYMVVVILLLDAVFLAATRYLILSSLMVMACLPAAFYFLGDGVAYVVFSAITLLISLYVHREDIVRLVSGHEVKIGDALDRVV